MFQGIVFFNGIFASFSLRYIYSIVVAQLKETVMKHQTEKQSTLFKRRLHSDGIESMIGLSRYVHCDEVQSNYRLCAAGNALLTYGQLEACRKVVTRIIKRQKPKAFFLQAGKVSLPFTKKSKNARMGKGKGVVQGQLFRAQIYSTLFLLRNVYSACAVRAAKHIMRKLNITVCLARVTNVVVEVGTAYDNKYPCASELYIEKAEEVVLSRVLQC